MCALSVGILSGPEGILLRSCLATGTGDFGWEDISAWESWSGGAHTHLPRSICLLRGQILALFLDDTDDTDRSMITSRSFRFGGMCARSWAD